MNGEPSGVSRRGSFAGINERSETRDKFMPVVISPELRQKLVLVRKVQLQETREKLQGNSPSLIRTFYDELQSIDGIHLWGTIGVDLYLTLDGRTILSEDRGKHGQLIEETCKLAFQAIGFATSAYAYDLPELLGFLPEQPAVEFPCSYCHGERTVDGTQENSNKRACYHCLGLGWGKHGF